MTASIVSSAVVMSPRKRTLVPVSSRRKAADDHFPFNFLPVECQLHVLSFLNEVDKCSCALVCLSWSRLVRSWKLWRVADFSRRGVFHLGQEGLLVSNREFERWKSWVHHYTHHLISRRASLLTLKASFDLGDRCNKWSELLSRLLDNVHCRDLSHLDLNWTFTLLEPLDLRVHSGSSSHQDSITKMDQFSGAPEQTHPQLPARRQDAAALRLVGLVRVAARPVPAAPSPRAQVLLGLQRRDAVDAADADQIPAQPEIADFAHPGAAEEPRHLVHPGVPVAGVPGRVAQPGPRLLLPEAAGAAGAPGQEDRPRDHAGPADPAAHPEPVALPVPRPPGGDAEAPGPQQREAPPDVERRELRGDVGHPGTVLLLRSASGQLALVADRSTVDDITEGTKYRIFTLHVLLI
ncbi:uncharacterized protein [Brachyistius frenatus]